MTNISDLSYFVEIARLGSMRKASERFHIAPSVLSRRIAQLEQKAKTPLFERRPDGVQLTDAGHVFMGYATTILQKFDNLHAEMERFNSLDQGRVRIATVEGISRVFLSHQIAGFRSIYPRISFQVEVLSRDRVLDALEAYRCELGFVYDHFSNPTMEAIGQWRQPLLAFAPPDHPCADGRVQSLAQLSEFDCALPDDSFAIHGLVERTFAKEGLTLKVALISNQLQVLLSQAIDARLIIFLPLQAARLEVERGALVPLNMTYRAFEHRFISAVMRRGRVLSRATDAFALKAVQEFDAAALEDAELMARITADLWVQE